MMKYNIFKGLLFCGCMMSMFDSEGMRSMKNEQLVVVENPSVYPEVKRNLSATILPNHDSSRVLRTSPQEMARRDLLTVPSSQMEMVERETENTTSQQSHINPDTTFSNKQAQDSTSMTFTAENIEEKFYNLSEKDIRNLTSITFKGVDINKRFIEKFNDVFYHGSYYKLADLNFENCKRYDDMKYSQLLEAQYVISNLVIIDDEFDDKDAIATYRNLYPWMLASVNFHGKKLNEGKIMDSLVSWELPPDGILTVSSNE